MPARHLEHKDDAINPEGPNSVSTPAGTPQISVVPAEAATKRVGANVDTAVDQDRFLVREPDAGQIDEQFDDALKQVIVSTGGQLLFRMPSKPGGRNEIAAVRLGDGNAQMLALVTFLHDAPMRIELIEESGSPLAPIVKSFASLVDVWEAAA